MMKTKKITMMAFGVALYVCVSMVMKIPIVDHISLDLGYIVLAMYCYLYGGIYGAVVGSLGCFLVSLITTGWIAIGWPLGNLLIGFICGIVYRSMKNRDSEYMVCITTTIIAVFLGVAVIKTVVECTIYSLPMGVKFVKNLVAFVMDASVMCIGYLITKQIGSRIEVNDHV